MSKSFLSRTWDRLNSPIGAKTAPPAAHPEASKTPLKRKSLAGMLFQAEVGLDALATGRCDVKGAIDALYGRSSIVYACIQRYLFSISPIRWEVKRREGDNKFVPVSNHPYERLLAYPNMHMSGGSMNRRIVQHLLGPGNAYWRKQRGANKKEIIGLMPMQPELVAPIPDPQKFLGGYKVSSSLTDSSPKTLPTEDVIHFMLEDPADMFNGIGVVASNKTTIESDFQAEKFWFNTIKKAIRKDGILSFKHDPVEEELENWEDMLRQEVIGFANAGGVLLLGQEHTWTDLSKNSKDVDFIEARKMLRELIAAIFSVPPPMVGILDNSTYNNIQMARMIFWLDTLLPFLEIIRETWTRCLFQQEFEGEDRYNYIIDYDVSSIEALFHVFGQRMDIALKMFKLGVDTREIIRALQLNINENAVRPFGFLPNNMRTVDTIIEADMKGDSTGVEDIFGTEVPQSIGRDQENPDARETPDRERPDLYTRRGL